MSFINRTYPDVVRDVLTNLTQGVTGERHTVEYDGTAGNGAGPVQVPDIVLLRRPVRRVSLVTGFVAGPTVDDDPLPHTFGLNDYELVPDPNDPTDLHTIRFRPFGRRPAPGTELTVNYYPRNVDKTPVTDMNVGSVARTLMEALSKEIALLYAQLNLAYDSGFLESATGSSLDRVVALLGLQRYRAGRPMGTVTFRRRAGSPGNITIPPGTPITDAANKILYHTIETRTMLAGESIAEVQVRASTDGTPPVEAGVLTVIQRAIAGLDSVTNERPTTRVTEEESDTALRARARGALLASNKGTVGALEHGLLQLPQVRDVKVVEMPNGVPGEVQLLISLAADQSATGELPPTVVERIEELRPAGIRVLGGRATSTALRAQVQLVLAGSHMAPLDIESVHAAVRKSLVRGVAAKGVGDKLRNKPLVAALLADERIVDATLTLAERGGTAGQPDADFTPPAGAILELTEENISFATDTFDAPLPSTGERPRVEVSATVRAQPLTGVAIETVRPQITARLTDYIGRLTPGANVDTTALLTALRDDAKYQLDPMHLQVTFKSGDMFVQVVQSGPAFQVRDQTFVVSTVEVTA
jgi:hypothetical protein